ncbi:hypothetical protein PAHAL_8G125000 [Panicum hallii]|uniref:Uncharacterized protein n=1 Tax=Panicum hallii TaxID=206008 RepID=A0A2T8I8R1_9POAL|nr:hypothetical protein PAHAL_8G125000 [Panicum hallii]
MAPSPVAAPTSSGDGAGPVHRRRRNRKRRGKRGHSTSTPPPGSEGAGDSPRSASGTDTQLVADAGTPPRRQCVISCSDAISQREERLAGQGLILSVIADDPASVVDLILPAVARRFKIEESLLSIHSLGPACSLLISPDELTATRIFNDGRPLSVPLGRVHVMRWSRFLLSSAATFSIAVSPGRHHAGWTRSHWRPHLLPSPRFLHRGPTATPRLPRRPPPRLVTPSCSRRPDPPRPCPGAAWAPRPPCSSMRRLFLLRAAMFPPLWLLWACLRWPRPPSSACCLPLRPSFLRLHLRRLRHPETRLLWAHLW